MVEALAKAMAMAEAEATLMVFLVMSFGFGKIAEELNEHERMCRAKHTQHTI